MRAWASAVACQACGSGPHAQGSRAALGQVTRVRVFKKDPPLYHIKYEDGDAEDVEERELRHILVIGDGGCVTTRSASQSQPSSSPAAARGRKRGAPQEAPASPPKQVLSHVAVHACLESTGSIACPFEASTMQCRRRSAWQRPERWQPLQSRLLQILRCTPPPVL